MNVNKLYRFKFKVGAYFCKVPIKQIPSGNVSILFFDIVRNVIFFYYTFNKFICKIQYLISPVFLTSQIQIGSYARFCLLKIKILQDFVRLVVNRTQKRISCHTRVIMVPFVTWCIKSPGQANNANNNTVQIYSDFTPFSTSFSHFPLFTPL